MRALLLPLVAGLAAASAAMAQPASGPGDKATLCLDPGGVDHAPLCRSHNATRLVQPPDICVCDGPYRQVEAPWCAKGEKPPNLTAEYERARNAYAMSHANSVIGGTYEGRRMCVTLDYREP
jgi:hypothetical protein